MGSISIRDERARAAEQPHPRAYDRYHRQESDRPQLLTSVNTACDD